MVTTSGYEKVLHPLTPVLSFRILTTTILEKHRTWVHTNMGCRCRITVHGKVRSLFDQWVDTLSHDDFYSYNNSALDIADVIRAARTPYRSGCHARNAESISQPDGALQESYAVWTSACYRVWSWLGRRRGPVGCQVGMRFASCCNRRGPVRIYRTLR